MAKKADLDLKPQTLAAGDQWLRDFGIVHPQHFNVLSLNIRGYWPDIKHLEWAMDRESQRLVMVVYKKFRLRDLVRKHNIDQEVYEFVSGFLPTYEVSVICKRYKPGVENETVFKFPESSDDSNDSPSES